MKKHLLILIISILSTSAVYAFNGVKVFNGFQVKYITTGTGYRIAVLGMGMLKTECFHDGVEYAILKGTASTCPGFFNVFPDGNNTVPSNTIVVTGSSPENIIITNMQNKHYSGSPACQETAIEHDPFR